MAAATSYQNPLYIVPTVSIETSMMVANAFVKQYYQVFQKNPENLYLFYTDSSVLTLTESVNGPADIILTQENIKARIAESTIFVEALVEVLSVKAQGSEDGSVAVMTTGLISNKNSSVKRKFMQLFHLARQERGFYLSHDIFRFKDNVPPANLEIGIVRQDPKQAIGREPAAVKSQEPVPPAESAPLLQKEMTVSDSPVPDSELNCQNHQNDSIPSYSGRPDGLKNSNSVNSLEPKPAPITNESDEKVSPDADVAKLNADAAKLNADVATVHADVEAGEKPKLSYASILSNSGLKKDKKVELAVLNSSKRDVVRSHGFHKPSSAVKAIGSQKLPSIEASAGEVSLQRTLRYDSERTSIHIRNLPPQVTKEEVIEEFQKFGAIKPNGIRIRVRNQLNGALAYGFVDFESTDSFQAAIDKGTIVMNGFTVKIKEKRLHTGNRKSIRGHSGAHGRDPQLNNSGKERSLHEKNTSGPGRDLNPGGKHNDPLLQRGVENSNATAVIGVPRGGRRRPAGQPRQVRHGNVPGIREQIYGGQTHQQQKKDELRVQEKEQQGVKQQETL